MSRQTRLIGLLLLLGLLAAALAFPGLFDAYVVKPASISLWAIWRLIISVDQGVYWILVITCCSALMLRVFSAREQGTLDSTPGQMKPQPARLEHWRRLFRNGVRSGEGQAALRASLRNLLAASTRQPDGPAGGLSRAVAARHASLPPAVKQYLAIDDEGNAVPPRPLSPLAWVQFRIRGRAAQDGILIEEVLCWMEAAMEISDDKQ